MVRELRIVLAYHSEMIGSIPRRWSRSRNKPFRNISRTIPAWFSVLDGCYLSQMRVLSVLLRFGKHSVLNYAKAYQLRAENYTNGIEMF